MNRKKQFKQAAETTAITAAAVCINITAHPPKISGFSRLTYLPYLAAALFTAVFYSRWFGFLFLIETAAARIHPRQTIFYRKTAGFSPSGNNNSFSAAVLLIYLFGTIRDIDRIKIKKTKEHLRQAVKRALPDSENLGGPA